jgi:hypothetical protein
MKEMNSLTHSCMHSLASLAILALSGRAVFMIRATGAKLRILASDAVLLLVALEPRGRDEAAIVGGPVEGGGLMYATPMVDLSCRSKWRTGW